MICIREICRYLEPFQPIEQSISEPDCDIFQLCNGLPEANQLTEHTAYILSESEMERIPPYSESILYIIIHSGGSDQAYAGVLRNYCIISKGSEREELYRNMQQVLGRLRRIDYAYHCLSTCLLNQNSLEEILAAAEKVLGNPLFLSDTTTRVLKFSSLNSLQNVKDELIQCVIQNGFVLPEYFEKYDYNNLLPLIEKNEKSFFLKSDYEKKENRIIVKLNVNRHYFGWIVLYPCNQPFQDGDCEIMDILSRVLSLEMERNKIGFALSCRENLLMELLSGHISSTEEFCRRAESFDWTPGEDYYVMAITFCDEGVHPGKQRTITAYKNHLGLIYPSYRSICIDNVLLLLLETDDLTSVIRNLEGFFRTYQLSAGCSEHFTNVLRFKEYYEQAMELLNLGMRLKPRQTVYRYEELYLYYMISELAKKGRIESYCMPEIRSLVRYDQKNNTCYIETLRAYLKFRNALTTAEYLHIHRNTLNYRFQKIEEMTKLRLTEGDDLYQIWFSIMILELFPDLG